MTPHDVFLADIIAHPEDDTPRLIYADWLEDNGQPERAEFIRLQLELAKPADDGQSDPVRGQELQAREQQLLREHQKEWVRPLEGLVESCWFRRGFIEDIHVQAEDFLAGAGAIFASAPVQHADLLDPGFSEEAFVAALAHSPYLDRLKSLGMSFGIYKVCDRALQDLAWTPPLLQRLVSLYLMECSVTEAGLGIILMSPHLRHLRRLTLRDRLLSRANGLRLLVASPSLADLTELSLTNNCLGDEGTQFLAASPNLGQLRYLDLAWCHIGDAGAEALARSPRLSPLTSLYLIGNDISDAGREPLRIRFGDRVHF
jgi:uncharacterized protein (TIGR02996 family)